LESCAEYKNLRPQNVPGIYFFRAHIFSKPFHDLKTIFLNNAYLFQLTIFAADYYKWNQKPKFFQVRAHIISHNKSVNATAAHKGISISSALAMEKYNQHFWKVSGVIWYS
jgi:hypothetical protein